MILIRPIKNEDINPLLKLASDIGAGMTTIPATRDALAKLISSSEMTFTGQIAANEQHSFFMVAQCSDSGEFLGTTAIYKNVGNFRHFIELKLRLEKRSSAFLRKDMEHMRLELVQDLRGLTEIGSLMVTPKARGKSIGKMLSKSRWILFNNKTYNLGNEIFAEIRGWLDEKGVSPFYEYVTKPFLDLDFAEADRLSGLNGSQFIVELFPQSPLYTKHFPKEVRQCIGKPHKISEIAYNMLLKEGMETGNYIDVLDAGPVLTGDISKIKSIQQCQHKKVQNGQGQDKAMVGVFHDNKPLITMVENASIMEEAIKLNDQVRKLLTIGEGENVICLPIS